MHGTCSTQFVFQMNSGFHRPPRLEKSADSRPASGA